MGYQRIGELVDKWMNDPEFRAEVRKDPEGAVKRTGVNLSAEEQAAFRKIDWSMPDEQLKTNISKIP